MTTVLPEEKLVCFQLPVNPKQLCFFRSVDVLFHIKIEKVYSFLSKFWIIYILNFIISFLETLKTHNKYKLRVGFLFSYEHYTVTGYTREEISCTILAQKFYVKRVFRLNKCCFLCKGSGESFGKLHSASYLCVYVCVCRVQATHMTVISVLVFQSSLGLHIYCCGRLEATAVPPNCATMKIYIFWSLFCGTIWRLQTRNSHTSQAH